MRNTTATPWVLSALLVCLVGCGPLPASPADAGVDAGTPTDAGTTYQTPNSVGFVGCSLSLNAVKGYLDLGGEVMWPISGGVTGYPGGGLNLWVSQLKGGSSGKSYWSSFSSMLASYPNPRAIWWELCPNAATATVTYADTVLVLEEIKRLAPGAKVYVTGVPIYPLDGAHCSINTDAGAQATLDLASQLVSNGVAEKGPTLSALTTAQVGDGCHANPAGQAVWGQNLADVFGKGAP